MDTRRELDALRAVRDALRPFEGTDVAAMIAVAWTLAATRVEGEIPESARPHRYRAGVYTVPGGEA